MNKHNLKDLQLNITGKSDTDKYDKQFAKISFYQQYPQFYPYVGKNYDKYKMLIIGESHYLDKDSTFKNTPENWYKSNIKNLNNKDQQTTCIRRVVNNIQEDGEDGKVRVDKWRKSRTIWRNIAKIFAEFPDHMPQKDEWNLMSYAAVMNGFMRPAEKTGKSIKVEDEDVKKSVEVIDEVLTILKPNYICFASKKAYNNLVKNKKLNPPLTYDKDNIIVVPHPASAWWNRETKNKTTGKQAFLNFVKKAVS